MKYCLFIPSTPEHFKNVDLILEMYKNGTEQPDEIIVSLSKSYEVNNELIDNIEKKYNCNIIRHDTIKLAGPNRQCAINATSDVIIYHDSDDYPHHQRIEIIKHFFETYDIVHLNHDYLFKSEYEKHKNNNIDINNIKIVESDYIRKLYFPNNMITDPLNITNGYGDKMQHLNIFSIGAHGGAVCIKKDVLHMIKWKDRSELRHSPGWNIPSYRGAEDYEFNMELLFKLNKSIIINAELYYY